MASSSKKTQVLSLPTVFVYLCDALVMECQDDDLTTAARIREAQALAATDPVLGWRIIVDILEGVLGAPIRQSAQY